MKTVYLTTNHNYVGMTLVSKLNFDEYLKSVLSKITKMIGLLKHFQEILLKVTLLTFYKSFASPQLDYEI